MPSKRGNSFLLGEALGWRMAMRRFRGSNNRWLAARNIGFHAVRAIIARTPPLALAQMAAREASIRVSIAASLPFGLFQSPHQLLEHWTAPDRALGERVALFVHFDRDGEVAPPARSFIASLREAGLDVVFVTNSGRICDEAKDFLKRHCAAILIRRNIGYDFGAWRDALDTLGLPQAGTRAIFLVNDSVYGPFADLKPLLAAIDFGRADLWGATESWQHRYHLQSFFLGCGEAVIRSPAWQNFWRSVRPIPSKDWIIRHCEVGFTGAMARGGARCAAIFPSAMLVDEREIARLEGIVDEDEAGEGEDGRLRAEAIHAAHILRCVRRRKNALNPSVDLWRQLLRAGYPFLKRELLLRNPSRVTDVFEWEEVVSDALKVDPQPLGDEIRRSLGSDLSRVWSPSAEL